MTEVRTTVDEKLVNQMADKQEPIEEPIKEEAQESEQSKISENKVSAETDYELPPSDDEVSDKKEDQKDEYGNEITSKKVYTEEEVNELMRQRFNRNKREEATREQPKETQIQTQEGEENWESQLEGFVENTVRKLTLKEQQKIREEKERDSLDRLQVNIHTSMSKYKDFKDVVSKVPMSDYMVKATKSFKDPGAFIYAASKTQSKELERISRLDDPLDQAAEIGKLEERMRKIRQGSNSPKPVSQVSGDVTNRENVRGNIDDLIRKDAMKKLSNRRY